MSMAEASHPVIELVPGIEVDFIVQRGMSLRLGGRQAPFTGNRMGERDNAGNIVNDRTGTSVNVTVH